MDHRLSRRGFLATAAATTLAARVRSAAGGDNPMTPNPGAPVIVASANGLAAAEKTAQLLAAGADTLDAVIAGVNLVEADPNDHSVGLGGLPNEDGVVELDASVMHGPTHKSGAVAALHNIVHASSVAKLVAERTDHALLVGEGALRFAKAHGFKEENLLTEEARKIWLKWKETHSDNDDWLQPREAADPKKQSRGPGSIPYTHGTVHVAALDVHGNLSGCTSTSGLSYKIPDRVGDSPIIGAGLYVDNEIGTAGSTGRGESVIVNCGAFAIVELMRHGAAPQDACLEVLRRIVAHTKDRRLLDDQHRPNFDVKLYALAKDGRFGAASLRSGAPYAVWSEGKGRLEQCAYLFKRET